MKGIEAYQVKKILKKLEETLRNREWSEMRQFGRENREVLRERSNKMRFGLHRQLKQCISKSRQMKVSKGVETSVEEGIEKNGLRQIQVSRRCRGTNHQIHEQKLDRSTRCREAIEDAETFSIDPPIVKMLSRMQKHSRSIHQVSRSCRDCDKKTLKKLDKQQGIEQVSRRC